MNTTQKDQVHSHLVNFGNITSWEAIMKYRITRLSEYIRDLRSDGLDIVSTWEEKDGKRWVRYSYQRKI